MPDSAPGQTRPDEARCYNCGTSGHWAIACPEPTRETPAGLAAWRNANTSGQGGHKEQHGGSKKSKGPIITNCDQIRASPRLWSSACALPRSSLLSSPVPSIWICGSWLYARLRTSSRRGHHPHHTHGHMVLHQLPVRIMRPTARTHHISHILRLRPRHTDSMRLRTPLPFLLTAHLQDHLPHHSPAEHRDHHLYHAQAQSQRFPCHHLYLPSHPSLRNHLNLVVAVIFLTTLRQPEQKPHENHQKPETKAPSLPKPIPSPKQEQIAQPAPKQESSTPIEKVETKRPDTEVSKPVPPQVPDTTPNNATDADDLEWDEKTVFKELETAHPPDEVGKPLPAEYNDEVLLPRKWDAKCIESNYVKADNIEEYVKPIHETPYWSSIEFDPAFVRDGKLPSGEAVSKLPAEFPTKGSEAVRSESSESGEVHEQRSKRGHSSDNDRAERPLKRQRSQSASNPSRRGSNDGDSSRWDRQGVKRRSRRDSSGHRGTEARGQDRRSPERTISYHRDRSREDRSRGRSRDRSRGRSRDRSRGRSRTRTHTPASRSVSNASSGLDSLEAELLGRDTKAKTPEETPKRKPSGSNKPKRRQTKLDSAYRPYLAIHVLALTFYSNGIMFLFCSSSTGPQLCCVTLGQALLPHVSFSLPTRQLGSKAFPERRSGIGLHLTIS
ncbi:uncharacterized protein NECHADRAFT_90818 [Fusarium vanettenii 77-13-4]|uniref:CCHC-type domain-containing protein n=1 Tax=Fusarium vanettenii (strain ATCC MYA-4622 / CBS 123669 / FGSC 9596 / NRRL 45880 / 77-13-4) TaxID=660122 RepID=C7Z6S1_FUSV7|nr:uncharacterized protein NECHADRAFT_90818 [Fusarium vanettenii 77-13-4]EEU40178.1 hypothetical protein NECHADRAFT_90818 [Fusarium vanettenii 77-13-4]